MLIIVKKFDLKIKYFGKNILRNFYLKNFFTFIFIIILLFYFIIEVIDYYLITFSNFIIFVN